MGGLRKAAKKANVGGSKRWDESFKDDQFQPPQKPTLVRLGPSFEQVPTHYVEFYSKKKGGKTGFYKLCLNYNYETGEKEDRGCPYCEAGINVSDYFYGSLISRREQKSAGTIVRPVRLTGPTINAILDLTDSAYPDDDFPEGWEDEEGPEANDRKYGFDFLFAKKNKSGKTTYEVNYGEGGKKPLKKAEVQAFKDFEEQFPIGLMAKRGVESLVEAKTTLARIGLGGESGVSNDDSLEEEEERPARKHKKRKKKEEETVKRSTVYDDDGDEEEEDFDEDEDNDVRQSYASADDEDEPDFGEDEDFDDDEF